VDSVRLLIPVEQICDGQPVHLGRLKVEEKGDFGV
jgi:hypothetical protein